VLIVRDHLIASGGTQHFLDVLPRIDAGRLKVCLVLLANRRETAELFENRGIVPWFIGPIGPRIWRLKTLLQIVDRFRPDLLHLSGPKSMLWGRPAARLRGISAVVLFNNALGEPAAITWLLRRMSNWPTVGIAVSEAIKRWASQRYGLRTDHIEVIYGGRDLAPFLRMGAAERTAVRRRIRGELGIEESAGVIGLVGRVLDRQKGQLGMIRSMQRILSATPTAHLMIVGDGEDLDACKALAQRLRLGAHITFTGNRSDMPEVMAALDLLVVPSHGEEGLPFAALEGAASGLPIVAFRSGGLPEVVLDGETGGIADQGDWDSLAALCCKILAHPKLADAMGARGRGRAKAMGLDAYVEAVTALHERFARMLSSDINLSRE